MMMVMIFSPFELIFSLLALIILHHHLQSQVDEDYQEPNERSLARWMQEVGNVIPCGQGSSANGVGARAG